MMMLPAAFESQGGDDRWHLDLETGDVFPVFDDPDEEARIDSDPDRFLVIDPLPSPRDDFSVMEDFVIGLPNGEAKRDLERVLRQAKPFRNFREALRD
jgi:hypothetical protein